MHITVYLLLDFDIPKAIVRTILSKDVIIGVISLVNSFKAVQFNFKLHEINI